MGKEGQRRECRLARHTTQGHEIVIIGTPPEFDDSVPDDDPRRHNCDAMGCGLRSRSVPLS